MSLTVAVLCVGNCRAVKEKNEIKRNEKGYDGERRNSGRVKRMDVVQEKLGVKQCHR